LSIVIGLVVRKSSRHMSSSYLVVGLGFGVNVRFSFNIVNYPVLVVSCTT